MVYPFTSTPIPYVRFRFRSVCLTAPTAPNRVAMLARCCCFSSNMHNKAWLKHEDFNSRGSFRRPYCSRCVASRLGNNRCEALKNLVPVPVRLLRKFRLCLVSQAELASASAWIEYDGHALKI